MFDIWIVNTDNRKYTTLSIPSTLLLAIFIQPITTRKFSKPFKLWGLPYNKMWSGFKQCNIWRAKRLNEIDWLIALDSNWRQLNWHGVWFFYHKTLGGKSFAFNRVDRCVLVNCYAWMNKQLISNVINKDSKSVFCLVIVKWQICIY